MPFEDIVQYILQATGRITVYSVVSACGVGNKKAIKAIRAAQKINPNLNTNKPRERVSRLKTKPVAISESQSECQQPTTRRRRRELHYVIGDIAAPVSRYSPNWPPGGRFEVR